MTTRIEIVNFLNLFKGCVAIGTFAVRGRQENLQGLIDIGITLDKRREILLGLQPEDYVDGPMPDDTDCSKNVWVFGKMVNEIEVYIKLRVAQDPKKRTLYHALVWSFHPAKYPMEYLLRGEK